jgi:SHS family lactate transporter-like MFS transporter
MPTSTSTSTSTRPTPWWREPTRAQWATFLAAWTGWVLDAFDFTIFLMVQNQIAKEFDVKLVALAGSVTLTLLVRLAGGFAAGWMADRWGRKLPLMLSLLWFAVFDAAIYFAPSFAWILVLRTLFGFGMGAEWTAGTALAMESFPARSRKIASGLLQAGWPIGFFLSATVAEYVVPHFGWRAVFLVAAVPALLVLPIRFLVPDEPAAAHAAPLAERRPRSELLAPGILRRLVLGTLVMALGFVVYYGLTTQYVPMLTGLAVDNVFGYVKLFNLGMLVGVVVVGVVANRWGVIVALVAPASLMLIALPLYVGEFPTMLALGAVLGGAFGAGYSGVTPVLITSMFPYPVRARAIGLVYHAGALISSFVPTTIALLAEHTALGLPRAIAVVVGGGLVALIATIVALRGFLAPTAQVTETLVAPAAAATIAQTVEAGAALDHLAAAIAASRDSRPVFSER